MKPLVVIPVRGGSKGIPNKNIKKLKGKPLIEYTLDAAKEVFPIEQICISTDSVEIKNVAEKNGLEVPFLRPDELATDTASTYDVLIHALEFYEKKGYSPEVVIILQATSPFRGAKHILEALKLFDDEMDMLVSVKETKSNPYYVLFEEDNNGWLVKSKSGDFTRRQDCPQVWEYNGAIYIINTESLRKSSILNFQKIKKYVMEDVNSLDLDTPLDWMIAEKLLETKEFVRALNQ
ncbi:cytidylyltransferase domain-containing protein [Flagellimonas algicola]|uniref:Acylneuraminate cytidylyltransferase family protein n=1 Tax=Flagellimonas algicola TaxID=2583815 RepID=A0ABY2WKJ1_9FLAO|nr:acylneuraminate cytidylyltransferase family protein [Allomuricauda algicola]TMU55057.1 acylneuraminate cytidylyltransferase family protein [Allomuricauda algicola]